MIRYGAAARAMRPMVSEDLLLSRLRLLIIMAKAYLKGYPLGDFRKNAITNNSRRLFYDVLSRSINGKIPFTSGQPASGRKSSAPTHLFLLRAQLLAVMLNASVKGKSKGNFRNKAMAENIDQLSKYMADRFQINDAAFLKVA